MMSTGDPVQMSDARGQGAFERMLELEPTSTQIFLNQPLFVPGLLQVAGYAAEMISRIALLKPDDPGLAARVAARMQRADAFEKRLHSASPPQLWAAIDEAALRRHVGGRQVMREQLDHLAAMSRVDTVHLAIIPLDRGAHEGLGGSFEVHEAPGGDLAVYFEGAPADELVETDQSLGQRYREKAQRISASALSGEEARVLLEEIKSKL